MTHGGCNRCSANEVGLRRLTNPQRWVLALVMQSLDQLLADCTVKLAPSSQGWGTGFFVAPGQLLTCAHVVAQHGTEAIPLWWRGQEWGTATMVSIAPAPLDLALLQVEPIDAGADAPPCVWLEAGVHPQQDLYLYGYPDQFPEGAAATVTCEGTATQEGLQLIKFKLGQIRPGFSGSPLLNLATGKVCGLVIKTLDRGSNLGGLALSATEILACYPDVQEQSLNFHRRDRRWQIALSRTALVQTAQQMGGAIHPLGQLARDRALGQLARDRALMSLLKRVQTDHIDLPLQNSLFNLDPLTLTKVEQPQAVTPQWEQSLLVTDPQAVETADSIGAVWQSCGGKVLILGQPGAGKSTTLLMLAQTLVNQAFADPQAAIPVLFNLASWSESQSLGDWLVQELDSKYGVSRKRGRDWLEQRYLIPLLDGLDEHRHPEACVEAINTFLADSRVGPDALAVCSRREEYHTLSTQLNLNGAVLLQPLSDEQIAAYLARFPDLVGMDHLLENPELLELMRSPLLLSVTAIAWRTLSLDHLTQLTTPAAQQRYLWQRYLERMLDYGERQNRDRPRARQFPAPAQTQHWLTYIAQTLTQTSQTDFLIEGLQPTWYPASLRQPLDWGLTLLKNMGLTLLVTAGILFLIVALWGLNITGADQVSPILLPLGQVTSLGVSLVAMGYGLSGLFYREIRLAESLKWSWAGFRQGFFEIGIRGLRLLGFLCGGIWRKIPTISKTLGFNQISILGMILAAATPLLTGYVLWHLGSFLWQHLISGRDLVLTTLFLALLLIIWVCLAIPKGIEILELDSRVSPGQGIRRNIGSTVIGFGLNLIRILLVWIFFLASIAALNSAYRSGLPDYDPIEDDFSIATFLMIIPFIFLMFWSIFSFFWGFQRYGGTAGLRYLMVRCLLTGSGVLPWNCARFLNRATELRLMQRIGGRYRFIHRTFQEHLASGAFFLPGEGDLQVGLAAAPDDGSH